MKMKIIKYYYLLLLIFILLDELFFFGLNILRDYNFLVDRCIIFKD